MHHRKGLAQAVIKSAFLAERIIGAAIASLNKRAKAPARRPLRPVKAEVTLKKRRQGAARDSSEWRISPAFRAGRVLDRLLDHAECVCAEIARQDDQGCEGDRPFRNFRFHLRLHITCKCRAPSMTSCSTPDRGPHRFLQLRSYAGHFVDDLCDVRAG